MAKKSLLGIVQEKPIPRSTLWARNNREKVKETDFAKRNTVRGKLISLIIQSRYRVKSSGLSHNIDTKYLQEIYEKQEGRCALTGRYMTNYGHRGTDDFWNSISLDRIDSSDGYIKGNVQLVCTATNIMKMDMSNELFIDICSRVTEYNNGKA